VSAITQNNASTLTSGRLSRSSAIKANFTGKMFRKIATSDHAASSKTSKSDDRSSIEAIRQGQRTLERPIKRIREH